MADVTEESTPSVRSHVVLADEARTLRRECVQMQVNSREVVQRARALCHTPVQNAWDVALQQGELERNENFSELVAKIAESLQRRGMFAFVWDRPYWPTVEQVSSTVQ